MSIFRRGRTAIMSLHYTAEDAYKALGPIDRAIDNGQHALKGIPAWAKGARVRRVGPLRNAIAGHSARVAFVVEATEWKGHK